MKKILAGLFLILSVFPASAQKSKSALQTEINTQWPDNNTQQITPKVLRGPPQDMVNSYLDLNGASSFACPGGQVMIGFSNLSTPNCAPAGSGSVTQVNTGAGLTGGPITSFGTISLNAGCANLTDASVFCNGTSAANLTGTLNAAQFPALTGDVTTTAGSLVTTLATVNSNVGTWGSSTLCAAFNVNGKGLITAAAQSTCSPAIASITGLGTGVATALAIAANGSGGLVTSPVANSNLATMAANTIKANATAGTAAPTDVACPASGVVSRNASGNISCQLLLDNNIFSSAGIATTKIGFGTGVATASANALNASGGLVGFSGALGTPTSGTLTNTTGLPIGGISATGTPSSTTFLRGDGSWQTPGGGGNVSTTGTPASGNLTAFSGATTITNSNLSGDCTTSGTLAVTCTKTNGTSFTTLATTTPGTGVVTALGNATNSAGGVLTGGSATTANLSDTTTDTSWTPNDASGASLTFTNITARYTKIGKSITLNFRLTFPSTANASSSAIGGFPVALSANFTAASPIAVGSCFYNSGQLIARMQASATQIDLLTSSGVGVQNSTLSGLVLSCMINYVSS